VIKQYHLIIDALVGVGLKGRLHSPNAELIKILNESGAMILSVDIPSGLDATSGRALGSCVRADETVTFVAKKKGMLEADGPSHCGNIRIADLGIPL
jgi:NAD(P)H-hydrate epimerase